MKKRTSGIYGIRNKTNGKMYVGQSVFIENRFKEHLRDLRKDNHYNAHLQRSFNKHFEESFETLILEVCKEEELPLKEQEWIDKYRKDELFNQVFDVQYRRGESNPFYGKSHTEKAKVAMSKAKKGLYDGENNPNFGKTNTKSTLIKMSEGRSEKLKRSDVLEIVQLLKEGITHKEISKNFNVGRNVITRISNGSRWTNVTGGPVVPVLYENGKRKQSKNHIANKSESKRRNNGLRIRLWYL